MANHLGVVYLRSRSLVGAHRIDRARRQLSDWDGKRWVVTGLPAPDASPDKIHVKPKTNQATDWLCFWVRKEGDENFDISIVCG